MNGGSFHGLPIADARCRLHTLAMGILRSVELGFPWVTADPFLFCVHHLDYYPTGNEELGPSVSLEGRQLGQDFEIRDGFRMYHGRVVPGFPRHPHRGFETVTIARQGLIDHSDSLGAAARFGRGDAQWITAGRGIVHSEMFPLLDREAPNTVELFQIWLNLPRRNKLAAPHFSMLWSESIPRLDSGGASLSIYAGSFEGKAPPSPPPASWASEPDSEVAIWTVELAPNSRVTLPPASDARVHRALYFYRGQSVQFDDALQRSHGAYFVESDKAITLRTFESASELLMLQGRPIEEPVAQYGPFVMNDRAGVMQAFADYQSSGFGGWPWPSDDPVHGAEFKRFARYSSP